MKHIIVIVCLACCSFARAWTPGGYVSPTSWITYVEGVLERAAAVERDYPFGSSGPPTNYVQSVRISLGLAKTNLFMPPGSTNLIGPVVCETSIVSGVTNVWCWTNHVALDTDFRRNPFQQYLEELFAETPDPTSGPYGAQIATNLVWTNIDSRLVKYDLPSSLVVVPKRFLLWKIDNDLKYIIPFFFDVAEMQRVVGNTNLTGSDLIDSYLKKPIGTNWIFASNSSGERWMSFPKFPSDLPYLTLSSVWTRAGIPIVRYAASIETNVVPKYGWESGVMTSYYWGVVTNIVTNWVEEYRFENTPVERSWSVLIGQLTVVATQTVRIVQTNISGGVTTKVPVTVKYCAPVDVRYDDFLSYHQHDSAFVLADKTFSNTLIVTPPSIRTNWPSIWPDHSVTVVGSAVVLSNGPFRPAVTVTSVVRSGDFQWTTSIARLHYDATLFGLLSILSVRAPEGSQNPGTITARVAVDSVSPRAGGQERLMPRSMVN